MVCSGVSIIFFNFMSFNASFFARSSSYVAGVNW